MTGTRDTEIRENTSTAGDGTTIAYRTLGSGPGLILVGGNLRTGEDYLPLAATLAGAFTVHVVDRRGRGGSGPQGPDYDLSTEVADLLAVRAATRARFVFGHSYGGLVALETERRSPVFDRIAVYEPGVPVAPVPTAWMGPYQERLAAGDPYGAFVHFMKGSGGAPAFIARMPYGYLKLVMRLFFRGATWRRMRPLLGACLAEHRQLAAQYGRIGEFAQVKAPVLVQCGARSPARGEYETLTATLPHATFQLIDRLDHFGPEGSTAPIVAERVGTFFSDASLQ